MCYMSTTLDIATLIVPGATAAAGAWYGARFQFMRERKSELARVIADAAKVLELADQRQGVAYVGLMTDGVPMTEPGRKAVSLFKQTLSEAAVLRDQMALGVKLDQPVYQHYEAALEALAATGQVLGVTAIYPDCQRSLNQIEGWYAQIDANEETFKRERRAFLDAARQQMGR